METKVVYLSEAKEGVKMMRHLLAGRFSNLRGCSQDLMEILTEYAKQHPEIMELKADLKSTLTVADLLKILVLESKASTDIMVRESEKANSNS